MQTPPADENALRRYLALQQQSIERSAVTRVPTDSLLPSESPRLGGEDVAHVRVLAESGALPPIVVHMPSRRVVDGMHRLRAALLRGDKDIEARFFHGTEADLFLLSVTANTRHGLPLSRQDRVAAAERVFEIHPEWSDRMVAMIVGLSGKKVADLRRGVVGRVPQSAVRVGRDGRSRPVDGTAGRERAADLMASDPGASLRRIAREAGISPATAADVRDRIRRGEDPAPRRRAVRAAGTAPAGRGGPPAMRHGPSAPDLQSILRRLCKDPSLRFTEAGRTLLRMFEACQAVVREEEAIRTGLPPHCRAALAEASHAYASRLHSFAAGLQADPGPAGDAAPPRLVV